MIIDTPTPELSTLCEQFQTLRHERKMRHRDAARALGISEGEAIAAHVGSGLALRATRLNSEYPALIGALSAAGPVMALTRNEAAVHERDGSYLDASVNGHVGLVLGPDIDLRIFYAQWTHGFFVEEETGDRKSRSLQFFDAQGNAVHKVFERALTDAAAFAGLAGLFAADDQTPGIVVTPPPPRAVVKPDAEIDVDGFQSAWHAMQDTHEFFGMLRKYGVARTQGLRLAGHEYARRVPASAARQVLEQASVQLLEIMVFVTNPGCIQIHTGPVNNIQVMGPWVNVLDPEFNLHLREDLIKDSWIVRKPTADGIVTSLEIYDEHGDSIAYFFGKRKPGIPELEAWRDLVAGIATEATA